MESCRIHRAKMENIIIQPPIRTMVSAEDKRMDSRQTGAVSRRTGGSPLSASLRLVQLLCQKGQKGNRKADRKQKQTGIDANRKLLSDIAKKEHGTGMAAEGQ